MPTPFWSYLDQYPPVLVRILSRNAGHAVSDEEIAVQSGLSLDRVRFISDQVTWNAVPIGEAKAFMIGCDMDLSIHATRKRAYDYIRKRCSFAYIRKSPVYKTQLLPRVKILERYRDAKAKKKTNND